MLLLGGILVQWEGVILEQFHVKVLFFPVYSQSLPVDPSNHSLSSWLSYPPPDFLSLSPDPCICSELLSFLLPYFSLLNEQMQIILKSVRDLLCLSVLIGVSLQLSTDNGLLVKSYFGK